MANKDFTNATDQFASMIQEEPEQSKGSNYTGKYYRGKEPKDRLLVYVSAKNLEALRAVAYAMDKTLSTVTDEALEVYLRQDGISTLAKKYARKKRKGGED